MSPITHIQRLFAYDAWANAQTLDALVRARLPPDHRATRAFAHVLAAKEIWLLRLEEASPPGLTVHPEWDLARCAERRTDLDERRWPLWLSTLDAARLESRLAYRTTGGTPFESRVVDILTHLVNHGAHHRGQIATHLRAEGREPARVDFILWARDQP